MFPEDFDPLKAWRRKNKLNNIVIIGSGDGLSHLGLKPLPEQMRGYCQLDPWGPNLMKPPKIFRYKKGIWKYLLQNDGLFVLYQPQCGNDAAWHRGTLIRLR